MKAKRFLVTTVATFFGSGFSPIASGTAGSLAALPFAYLLSRLGWFWPPVAGLIVLAIGSWAAREFMVDGGDEDDGRIVIDEVSGMWITFALVPCLSWKSAMFGFFFFRLFDIVKPPPANLIDRHWKSGFGVMADDVVAGIYAAVALFALSKIW